MNTTLTPADLDPRRQAMLLYFQGYRVARIAEMLGEKVATVHSWKKRDKWGDYGPLDQMQLTTWFCASIRAERGRRSPVLRATQKFWLLQVTCQSENARCAGAAHTKDVGNKAKKKRRKMR